MADILHDSVPLNQGVHSDISFEFADSSERIAATGPKPDPLDPVTKLPTARVWQASDLFKKARQLDDNSFWRLLSIAPVAWTQVDAQVQIIEAVASPYLIPTSFLSGPPFVLKARDSAFVILGEGGEILDADGAIEKTIPPYGSATVFPNGSSYLWTGDGTTTDDGMSLILTSGKVAFSAWEMFGLGLANDDPVSSIAAKLGSNALTGSGTGRPLYKSAGFGHVTFDGSDDVLTALGSVADYNFFHDTAKIFAWSTLVRLPSSGVGSNRYLFGNTDTTKGFRTQISTTNQLRNYCYGTTSDNSVSILVADDTWGVLVGTSSGPGGGFVTYLNGVVLTDDSGFGFTGDDVAAASHDFEIGNFPPAVVFSEFDCREVRLWNQTLSIVDAQEIYNYHLNAGRLA